ncbi:MAG: cell division protein FtsW [Alphaproteobacteria bacterium]|nr:cell division protein FtsW [Alphaproteobacteria bacterium]MBE8220798.1 cell division protein FtsW [Alphaproteobacteria bacterium]
MARLFSRTDKRFWSQWWYTVDRQMITLVALLFACGAIMAFAASPSVAESIGRGGYYLLYKQIAFLSLAFVAFIGVSMLPPRAIKLLAVLMFVGAVVGLALTLFAGTSIKGATRWIIIAGVSVQPVEFIKPAFAVVMASLLAGHCHTINKHTLAATGLLALVVLLLFAQPDIGQSALLIFLWGGIFFLAGGSMRIISTLVIAGMGLAMYAYYNIAHFHNRINLFFDPSSGNSYQIDKAMDAIRGSGFTGTGLGEGQVKSFLPDAHSDYVFAVVAEEVGLIGGVFVMGLFLWLIYLAFSRIRYETEHWVQLSAGALISLFGLQVFLNLAVNLNILPPKGMTLPFISYGGSSLLASGVGMGMLVGLTRKRIASAARSPASHTAFAPNKISGGIL